MANEGDAMTTPPNAPEVDVLAEIDSLIIDYEAWFMSEATRMRKFRDSTAALIVERDSLRKACAAVLDSSPKNICHRNAKEREAYKMVRRALGRPEGRHG